MKDAFIGALLVVVTISALSGAISQGFVEEIDRYLAVAWPIVALALFWILMLPKIGKGGTR